jgi:hypothetical protein
MKKYGTHHFTSSNVIRKIEYLLYIRHVVLESHSVRCKNCFCFNYHFGAGCEVVSGRHFDCMTPPRPGRVIITGCHNQTRRCK